MRGSTIRRVVNLPLRKSKPKWLVYHVKFHVEAIDSR